MNPIKRLLHLSGLTMCFFVATIARADAPFMPLELAPSSAPIVDEPIGERSSLGLTLWHMGHDANQIRRFHEFLKAKKIQPATLASADAKTPENAARVLLEPERLSEKQRNGWSVQDGRVIGNAGDNGPNLDIPLRVMSAGLYRGWIRYLAFAGGSAVTSLKIYRAGREAEGPILNDEIYDERAEKDGPAWKDFMVDLAPGDYVARLGFVVRWWHAGKIETGYSQRAIDLIYLTNEIWEEAPSDETLTAMRETGALEEAQISSAPMMSDAQKTQWKLWQVRPLSWENALSQPVLFALSREYWRQEIDATGKNDYGTEMPDYRAPERQIVFDDNWNLVANPVQIRRRIAALQSDFIATPSPHFSVWLQAGDFQNLEGGWEKAGAGLRATYGDFGGVAATDFPVDQPGEYSVWVRFGLLNGYYAPWTVTAENPGGDKISFNHDDKEYQSDWAKIGVLKMSAVGNVHFEISPQGFKAPGTYRNIYDFLLTTDADYVPQGNIRPPLNLTQYNARAKASGANESDPYLLWIFENAYTPLVQEVGDDSSWPISAMQAAQVQKSIAPAATKKIAMPADTHRAVQIGLRSLREAPLKLRISGGDLKGANGNYPGKVSWRAVGFVPQSENARNWSPYLVLRRPWITIPPRSVAGVWLTIDAMGVAPGEYSSQIFLKGEGVPDRTITLQVQVAPPVEPAQPVLVGGWTQPPEGEIYLKDYQAHKMRIWYGVLSKAEMQRRDIHLLLLPVWEPDEEKIRALIQSLKAGGLEYSDWYFSVKDEPHGATEEELKPFIDVAKTIHAADPQARVSFNPGEAATLATFQVLAPYTDFWLPYTHHRTYHPSEAEAKRAIFTAKPWMWYTTPDLWDKSPSWPSQIYSQIREVPGQQGNVVGTAFFAFYYPFRDAWDAGHEHISDVGVTVLPSRHGPVATRAWEAIREGIQDADLARAAKNNMGAPADGDAANKLLMSAPPEELLKAAGY